MESIRKGSVTQESEITLHDFREGCIPEPDPLEKQLQSYSIQDRKHLIVDWEHKQIIDTRNQEGNFSKSPRKAVSCTTLPTINMWESFWKRSEALQQQILSAICQSDTAKLTELLATKPNEVPIDINFRSMDDWTPLHYAATHATPNILKIILSQRGIFINCVTKFGWNALHIAVTSNKFELSIILLDQGIDINAQDCQLNTPLHYAVEQGCRDICKMLLERKANPNLKNNRGLKSYEMNDSPDVRALFEINENIDCVYPYNERRKYIEKMIGTRTCPQQPDDRDDPESDSSPTKKPLKRRFEALSKFYKLTSSSEPISLGSFRFFKKIGEGAFGEVYVVRKMHSDRLYALKAIKKEKVMGTALEKYVKTEKDVLSQISHPFIVKLDCAFQTEAYLFLVMEYCEGGDLAKLLQKKKKLDENITRLYAAEILLAIEVLHQNNIIYRDLKPQNIVIDSQGHVQLTDFGLSKRTENLNAINYSFCGTPAYLPLEIINKKGHNKMADWYEFGVVIFQMLTGLPPFYATTRQELYNKVRQGVICFQKGTSDTFRDLIKKLLTQNPEKRLGFLHDSEQVKRHPWFASLDWDAIYARKISMPKVDSPHKIPDSVFKPKFEDFRSERHLLPSWTFIC